MKQLKKMLFERNHPDDINKYINDNYNLITRNAKPDFIDSLLNPENLKPKRYGSFTYTKTFFHIKKFKLDSYVTIYPDLLFDETSEYSIIELQNGNIKTMNIHKDIVEMYRITSCGIFVEGEFQKDSQYYQNKKIVYIPYSIENLNFKKINSVNSNQNVILKLNNNNVTIIQHVEFIPSNKNAFISKKGIGSFKIEDEILKYKSFIITDYDLENFTKKIYEEYT